MYCYASRGLGQSHSMHTVISIDSCLLRHHALSNCAKRSMGIATLALLSHGLIIRVESVRA